MYHLGSPLYPNEANKPGYTELCTRFILLKQQWLENQSNQGCMAKVMQGLDEMQQVDSSVESYI
jgi:hypothetical protein